MNKATRAEIYARHFEFAIGYAASGPYAIQTFYVGPEAV
jgi:hypothetical protein